MSDTSDDDWLYYQYKDLMDDSNRSVADAILELQHQFSECDCKAIIDKEHDDEDKEEEADIDYDVQDLETSVLFSQHSGR